MVQLRHIRECISMQSAESITLEIPENICQTNNISISKVFIKNKYKYTFFFNTTYH